MESQPGVPEGPESGKDLSLELALCLWETWNLQYFRQFRKFFPGSERLPQSTLSLPKVAPEMEKWNSN
jgi:hypothetical protein